MTMKREKACCKDIAKSVIVNTRFVPQLKRFDDAYFFTTKAQRAQRAQRFHKELSFVPLW
jgi:hypothetical protein